MKQRYVLVVDDEPHMRRVLEIMLHKAGHLVFVAGNGREALEVLRNNPVDLVITDMRMPKMDGIELLTHLRQDGVEVPVIVITAHGSVESAVNAMKRGASDYILRPFDIDALELAIARVLNEAEVVRQNSFMREELNRGWNAFVGTSAAMHTVYELIRQVAPTKAPVMITGETGTGKELAARAIHNASPRSSKLFVPINCAAIPADILEAELFGYEKGAFTGAVKERVGKFELANEGTLFLDELTEMPMVLQAKLLRVLQENTLERLGSNRQIPLDIRVIAASNRPPRESIRDGHLREDLYYRLNVFAIDLPLLRERKEDIPDLASHFIAKHSHRVDGNATLSPAVVSRLQAYNWPGNVRELENMVERALILCGAGALKPEHFPLDLDRSSASPTLLASSSVSAGPLIPAVEALEALMIQEALAQTKGSKPRAAALLDISERTLWYKLKKYLPKAID
jgi:two-component system, NtrC family, response regulator AtoC